MKKLSVLMAILCSMLTAVPVFAAQVRVYVAEMNAVGVQNRDEMKATVQTLLASRLTGDGIVAVGSAAEADVLVTGTYVTIGKVFSVDALAKTVGGRTLTRAFVQGEGQDALIPAVGKLAEKLAAALAEAYSAGSAPAVVHAPVAAAPAGDIIRNDQQQIRPPAGDIIRARNEQQAPGDWLSKRIAGAANLLAVGKTLADGSREIFLAGDHLLRYYHQGAEMKLVAESDLGVSYKIISLDTIEGENGGLDIYVTAIHLGELASQVWRVRGNQLVREAYDLPYYFRAICLAGGSKKLYAQSMGRGRDDFFGDVAEATRSGSVITLGRALKMPRFGNIYNFNQIKDHEGKTLTLVFNPDGYLVVYDQTLKELWRSSDKYGGSELFFQREGWENVRLTGEDKRWIYMNQHIQVTSKGDVLVGRNDGFWVLGNARSYKKGTVYCLGWNGSSLEEKWRTKDTQNYMPDYLFDESKNELLLLQTVQRAGLIEKGASSIAIKKVE